MSKEEIIISEDQNSIEYKGLQYVFEPEGFCKKCDLMGLGVCKFIPCSTAAPERNDHEEYGCFKLV